MREKKVAQTSKASLLMLGGYLYPPTEFQLKLVVSKEQITKDIKRWKNDYAQFLKTFVSPKLQLFHSQLPKLQATKAESVHLIKSFFAQTAACYVLFWTGHGIPFTGDWDLTDGKSIALEEIVDMWIQGIGHKNKKLLVIVADSCHSEDG